MKSEIIELAKMCRDSSFNRSNYQVNIDLKNFVGGLLLHTFYDRMPQGRTSDHDVSNAEWLQRVVPSFQRANTKWSKSMKVKYVENLLKGVKSEILLFKMNEQEDAQIIDGLQRTTAILDFFEEKIKPFGYKYSELKEHLVRFSNHNLVIKVYTFNTWEEVGEFYVDMNENITHSKADIQKAKEWFLKEHNIKL